MASVTGQAGQTFESTDTLVVKQCPTCGVIYAIPWRMEEHANAKPSGDVGWYCPNGDRLVKVKSDLDRAQQATETERARRVAIQDQRDAALNEVQHQKARARGYKGAMVQTKRRAAKGVCPVAGCRRHFADVQRHVASKHPGWEGEGA